MSSISNTDQHHYTIDRPLRIGTRGSQLAVTQAEEVKRRLVSTLTIDPSAIEIRTIKTTGDILTDRPLSEVGGKGLFTKEIEHALLNDEIDIAVHSAKDMPTILPDGLGIVAFLEREDNRDAFISQKARTLDDLPSGAVVGTASLRRQAQVLRYRSDLNVTVLRGNVQTRLQKLKNGYADATLLAVAGLNRLNMTDVITTVLDSKSFMPACAQGAICIEARLDDLASQALVSTIHDPDTAVVVEAERAFLNALEGSCRMPIGGMATLDGETITLTGEVLNITGEASYTMSHIGHRFDAIRIGHDMGMELRSRLEHRELGRV